MPTREEMRTLCEFYPDPKLRHRIHYSFAHGFVPRYVQQNPYAFLSYVYRKDLPGGPMEPTRFIHSRWSTIFDPASRPGLNVDVFSETVVFRRVSDLKMSLHDVGGRAGAIIEMPLPEHPGEAFFIGVVLLAPIAEPAKWSTDAKARVFTLEATTEQVVGTLGLRLAEGLGVLCEWTKEVVHLNWGTVIEARTDLFVQAMNQVLNSPAARPCGSFTPQRNGPGVVKPQPSGPGAG